MNKKKISIFFLSFLLAFWLFVPVTEAGAAEGVKIDENSFPDEIFRQYVLDQFDRDRDGVLGVEECSWVTGIEVSNKSIASLKGVEYFTSLTFLNCGSNQLTSLDVSKNEALTTLNCYNNQLTSLDVSKNVGLIYLDCHLNWLTSLDVSKNEALTLLYCGTNPLTSLDVSKNEALTDLRCEVSQLTSLDVSKNEVLTELWCYGNQLTSLDISKNGALTELDCYGNQLTSLDVSKNGNLTSLDCGGNQLTSIDISKNEALTLLSCDLNPLMNLDVSEKETLTALTCAYTQLTSLDVSKNEALIYLYCHGNQLTSLDVSKNKALTELLCFENQLTSLDISKNEVLTRLECYSNQLTSLDVSKNTALTQLFCFDNQLTSLDVSKNEALLYFACGDNQLTSLDVSKNKALLGLNCIGNQLTSLDVSNNEALAELYCGNNQLTSLDVSKNEALTRLKCENNQLTNLDVSKNSMLTILDCSSNKGALCPLEKLTDLPGFDPTKASNWRGAVYDAENDKLTDVTARTVTYEYDCGSGYSEKFTLMMHYANETDGYCNVCANQIGITIGKAAFPDEAFRWYVLMNIDTNKDEVLEPEESSAVTYLDVSNKYIKSLKGVEYFTNLTSLVCSNNQLTSLDMSMNKALTELKCSDNQLTSLNVSKNEALAELNCEDNQLMSLDVSKNEALVELICSYNQLTSLDVSKNEALTGLHCYTNQLTSLDVSKNKALRSLSCFYNQLTSLDVSKNEALTSLECSYNQLTSLDVSKNEALIELFCDYNQLTSLDVSKNKALLQLHCTGNQLTSLDASKNSRLLTLRCDSNMANFCLLKKLTDLPGFDPAKASNWNGAVYDAASGKLTSVSSETVTYDYDCGKRYVVTFTLKPMDHADEDGNGFCDICGNEGDTQPTDSVGAFVDRIYTTMLERDPDANRQDWIDKLTSGTYTGAQIVEEFFGSAEFSAKNANLANEQFIKILYRTLFGREADEGGLAVWKGNLEEGYIRRYVLAGLANSQEFKSLCNSFGIVPGEVHLTWAEATPGLSEQEFNVWQFVERLYVEVLGRYPDQVGMEDWVGKIFDEGRTGASVAEGFIMSQEFLSKNMTNEEFVQIMYRVFFNRDADPTGLSHWTGLLGQGYSKRFVFAGCANSGEFQAVCNSFGITRGDIVLSTGECTPGLTEQEIKVWDFVERLYKEVLGRPADSVGLVDWVAPLLSGESTGAETAGNFIMSAEFLNKTLTNEEYVRIMYKAFFGREADEDGLRNLVGAMDQGSTKESVYAFFANSAEFGNLCNSYGIAQGSVAE